jgi:FkbM family methyltransferase
MSKPNAIRYQIAERGWTREICMTMQGDERVLLLNLRDLEHVQETLNKYVPRRRVAIQAGGNYGVFARYLSPLFDRVVTVEPFSDNFVKLVHNTRMCSNLTRVEGALHNPVRSRVQLVRERRYKTDRPPNDAIIHTAAASSRKYWEDVPTFTIDGLCPDACDLIYLDIEGDELMALRGASYTLRRERPVVVCEINANLNATECDDDAKGRLYAYLRHHDYAFVESFRSDHVFIPMERL